MPGIPRIGLFPGPAWYSSEWVRRWPIAVDAVTGGDSGSVDVNVAIPSKWDWFWDGVQDQTNGYDIIVCGQDGVTLLDFQYSGLNFTTRTLTIQIDALALDGTGKMEMIWLYWYKTSAVSNLTTPFTPSSPISGYVSLAGPKLYRLSAEAMTPGAEVPAYAFQVGPSDEVSVALDLNGILPLQSESYNGKYNLTGVYHVTAEVQAGGSGATATNTDTRYTYYENHLYVVSRFTGHVADTGIDTGKFTVALTNGDLLEFRFGLQTQAQVYV